MAVAAVAAALLFGVYAIAAGRARDDHLTGAHASANLYVQTLRVEIDRRRHIPEILATDDDLAPVAQGGAARALNGRSEFWS